MLGIEITLLDHYNYGDKWSCLEGVMDYYLTLVGVAFSKGFVFFPIWLEQGC